MQIEFRVGGRVGALVASAVSASQVRYVAPVTHLTIRSTEPIPLALLLRRLEELGLEVQQLRGGWRSIEDQDGTDRTAEQVRPGPPGADSPGVPRHGHS
jgi:hypothetical protein